MGKVPCQSTANTRISGPHVRAAESKIQIFERVCDDRGPKTIEKGQDWFFARDLHDGDRISDVNCSGTCVSFCITLYNSAASNPHNGRKQRISSSLQKKVEAAKAGAVFLGFSSSKSLSYLALQFFILFRMLNL